MDSEPLDLDAVPSSLPDSEVPAEPVITSTATRRKANRDHRFLKGPIPLSWVREYIRVPADRLLMVLCAHSDIKKSPELKMTADVERDAGIVSRKASYRALAALEAKGVLEVTRKPGSRPVVRLKARPGESLR